MAFAVATSAADKAGRRSAAERLPRAPSARLGNVYQSPGDGSRIGRSSTVRSTRSPLRIGTLATTDRQATWIGIDIPLTRPSEKEPRLRDANTKYWTYPLFLVGLPTCGSAQSRLAGWDTELDLAASAILRWSLTARIGGFSFFLGGLRVRRRRLLTRPICSPRIWLGARRLARHRFLRRRRLVVLVLRAHATATGERDRGRSRRVGFHRIVIERRGRWLTGFWQRDLAGHARFGRRGLLRFDTPVHGALENNPRRRRNARGRRLRVSRAQVCRTRAA